MEKLKPNELGPTLTLAKLYESQNQIIDALVTYKKLHFTKPEDETQQKIKQLQELLVNSSELSEPVKSIFTEKEVGNFMILSESKYSEYQEALESDMPLSEFPEELDVQENEIPEEPVEVSEKMVPVNKKVENSSYDPEKDDAFAELESDDETDLDIAKLLTNQQDEVKEQEPTVKQSVKANVEPEVIKQAIPIMNNLFSGILHCKVGDLAEKMEKHFGKQKKIGEISIFEMIGFIQDLKNNGKR